LLWLALVLTLLGASGASACSLTSSGGAAPSPSPSPTAILVGAGTLPADRSQTADLGAHDLGSDTWVAWELNGSDDSRSTFHFTLRSLDGDPIHTAIAGPASFGPHIVNDHAQSINGEPGRYRVSLRQVVTPQEAPGYDVSFRVFTSP